MSSADLSASMKALDLGLSPDSEVNPVERTTVSKRRPKLKPRKDSRLVNQVDECSVTPLKPLGKPEVDKSIPSGVPPSPQSSNNKSAQRRRKKRSNKTQTHTASSALPAKEQESVAHEAAKRTPQNTFVYVVLTRRTSEEIVGVFASLPKANECAVKYASQYGIPHTYRRAQLDETSWVGVFGDNSLSEVRVLPKEFTTLTGNTDFGTIYLALDRPSFLFVIGAYRSKDEAWEACQKYWRQLSYCCEIQGERQWVDRQGMPHARGAIAGRSHHWFVEPYDPIDRTVDSSVGKDIAVG